jgi:enamine deaminase RidA (YjgF/YER057c/UK114 family)
MPGRQLINPPELHPTPGFSHIALADSGRLVCIAGQAALASDFTIIGGDDLAEQTRAAMRNVKLALDAVGATWEHVVRRTIYTLQPTRFQTIAEAIEEVQGSSAHPPQTIVGVSGLALEGLLIEIEVTAVIP